MQHASQYPNAGIGRDLPLLDWLQKYTFPLESSFKDSKKAQHVYAQCVKRTLAHGTTTASYYGTIHVDATNILADICHGIGQRAFIGKVT
jgi:guanine deaminase